MAESRSGAGEAGASRWWYALAASVAVATVAIGGAVVLADRVGDGSPDAVRTRGTSRGDAQESGTTIECMTDEDFTTGLCGTDPEVLRETNLAYADRLDFVGDARDFEAASAVVERARAALSPLVGARPSPSPAEVEETLAPVSANVVVSDNAVRTAGVAFGIGVDGGCVFGSIHHGSLEVEVGGYVNDGGCLAEYGH